MAAPKPDPKAAAAPSGEMTFAQLAAQMESGNFGAAAITKPLGPNQAAISGAQAAGNIPAGFQPWMEEDEWMPASLAPDDQGRIKAYLAKAGFYGTGGYVPGGWTVDDASAMKSVLAYANTRGLSDPLAAAREYATTMVTEGVQAKAPPAPLVTRFANPEAVRQVVRKSSMDLLGMRLSDAEEARLVGGFQAQYQEAQRAQHAAGAADAGGSFTEAMDAETYAESQLQGTDQAGARRYLDAFDGIVASLGPTVAGPKLSEGGGVSY